MLSITTFNTANGPGTRVARLVIIKPNREGLAFFCFFFLACSLECLSDIDRTCLSSWSLCFFFFPFPQQPDLFVENGGCQCLFFVPDAIFICSRRSPISHVGTISMQDRKTFTFQ